MCFCGKGGGGRCRAPNVLLICKLVALFFFFPACITQRNAVIFTIVPFLIIFFLSKGLSLRFCFFFVLFLKFCRIRALMREAHFALASCSNQKALLTCFLSFVFSFFSFCS